jgi:hypothetical protein
MVGKVLIPNKGILFGKCIKEENFEPCNITNFNDTTRIYTNTHFTMG